MILHKTKKHTIWIDGSDLTFEKNSSGESFTLYCECTFCPYTEVLQNVLVLDYDGCFDFDRNDVIKSLENYYSGIEIDFSELDN